MVLDGIDVSKLKVDACIRSLRQRLSEPSTPQGEADLIALDGRTVVIVEVKRRDGRQFGTALSAVDYKKRTTLRAVGEDFAQIVAPGARLRFDVVAIDGKRLTLHRNAF